VQRWKVLGGAINETTGLRKRLTETRTSDRSQQFWSGTGCWVPARHPPYPAPPAGHALAIRDLTPGSVTVTVTVAQVISGSSGTTRSAAGWAVTLPPVGAGWLVWDIEPAAAGNS
jgi:hypothetical protein